MNRTLYLGPRLRHCARLNVARPDRAWGGLDHQADLAVFIIPTFQFLHWFIPNYGIVLILFAVIIKVISIPHEVEHAVDAEDAGPAADDRGQEVRTTRSR
jgi:hypothetical protein